MAPPWGLPSPPIGLAYISSSLRAAEYSVQASDLSIDLYFRIEPDFKKYWEDNYYHLWEYETYFAELKIRFEQKNRLWVREILDKQPYAVGFSVFCANRLYSLHLAEMIKKENPRTIIIFGGPECSLAIRGRSLIKAPQVDAVVFSEGEQTIVELARAIQRNRVLEPMPGAIIKRDGEVIESPPRSLIPDLDTLPFPDFSDYDFSLYQHSNVMPILGSRGCPYSCSFCPEKALWQKYRTRSAQNIYKEMVEHYQQYRIPNYSFTDQLINGNPKVLDELCDLIIKGGYKFSWGGNARAMRAMNIELLRKMKKAGCTSLDFGIESGSAKVLKLMNKNQNLKTVDRVFKDMRKARLGIDINLLVGFPGETRWDLLKTFWFLIKHRNRIQSIGSIGMLAVIERTPVYNHPRRFGIVEGSYSLNSDYWYTSDGGNTLLERRKRLRALYRLVRLLGIKNPFQELRQYDELCESAQIAIGLGKHDLALETLRFAIKVEPRKIKAISMAAELLARRGEYESSVKLYKKAARLDADNFQLILGIAEGYRSIGKLGREIRFLEAIQRKYKIKGKVFPLPLLLELASAYLATKRWEKVIELLHGSDVINQEMHQYWDLMAEIHILRGEKRDALQAIDKAISLQPENLWLQVKKGKILYLLLEKKAAEQTLNSVLAANNIDQNLLYEVYCEQGDLFAGSDRLKESLERLLEAVSIHPEREVAWRHIKKALDYYSTEKIADACNYLAKDGSIRSLEGNRTRINRQYRDIAHRLEKLLKGSNNGSGTTK